VSAPEPLDDARRDELLADADDYAVPAPDTFVVRSGEDIVWHVAGITRGEHHPDAVSAAARFYELVDELE
jgi:hypothetical protein